MSTLIDNRTDVQRRIDEGEIGKHLCCAICHPDSIGRQVAAICGAAMMPVPGKLSLHQVQDEGTSCPLCVDAAEHHIDVHILKGEYPDPW